jgi:hypothetical protein
MNGVATHNSTDRIYNLLPTIHRKRDEELGEPLRELLRVIAEQVNVVEEDILQLYENWFIETCQDWVAPYIGDLVGYQPVHEAGEPSSADTAQARMRNKILIPRRDVANTIQSRRRRGTLALLEELARDAAGWPARAVEFFRLLCFTQSLNHLLLERGRTVDLRWMDAFDLLDGPFDTLAHTVDVRSVASHRTVGRYNLPNVGVFVWRLREYPVTKSQAANRENEGLPHAYTFSFLGNDAPLYARTQPETDPTHIADESNLPVPIRRRAFEKHKELYYGENKSLHIWKEVQHTESGEPEQEKVELTPVPSDQIIPADLSDWERYRPPQGYLAVDPALGRIVIHPADSPLGLWVYYRYGFSADIGGGEYHRPIPQPVPRPKPPGKPQPAPPFMRTVGENGECKTLKEAYDQWGKVRQTRPIAILEIVDSGVYDPLNITLKKGESLHIRAADRVRPIIYLPDKRRNAPDSLMVNSKTGGCITLDGLLVAGRSVSIKGAIEQVKIRHCTLTPGWEITPDCDPKWPAKPSLDLNDACCRVIIEHSIVGSIQVYKNEVRQDPVSLNINDSIIDATSDDREAIGAPNCPRAHASLRIARCTVIGQVEIHDIALAEDCIFTGSVTVTRRQAGCMRFCYAPPESRTPRRFNCQPDLVDQAVNQKLPKPDQAEARARAKAAERLRVRPQFNSARFGKPAYCQLSDSCAEEIKRGASDESEIGAFHDLFQPQRAANLRARLDEFIPAGMDAGINFAS